MCWAMLVAGVFDARAGSGRPYFSPDRPRLVDPEERSRVVGYLACGRLVVHGGSPAPDPLDPAAGAVVPSGYRTDGVWVWPEALAYYARTRGVGPQAQLLQHVRAGHYLLPDGVPAQLVAEAVRVAAGPVTPDPPPLPAVYVAVTRPTPTGEARLAHLLRRVPQPDGGLTDQLTMPGLDWRDTDLLWPGAPGVRELCFADISARRAGLLLDELCAREHADELALTHDVLVDPVSGSEPAEPRRAVLFDRADVGRPYFSPTRLRILEPERRRRIEGYLTGAPLAVRVLGLAPDPLRDGRHAVVPLGYRTDGVWVWPEALAYYLRTHGVAPQFALLSHIEAHAYQPPSTAAPETLARAAQVARQPATASRPGPTPRYFTEHRDGPAGLLLREPRRDPSAIQVLGRDLRWRSGAAIWRDATPDRLEISEEAAAQIVDERWRRHAGGQG